MAFERDRDVPRVSREAETAEVARAGRRGRTFDDLSVGSVPRHIFRLSWPQVTEQLLNIIDQTVDMFWAGRLPGGFRALAGLGVAQTFSQFGFMSRQGLEQSTRAMVARAVGAGDMPLANRIALQSFVLTGGYSLFIVVAGVILTDILFRVFGVGQAIQTEAAMYMRIQFIGMGSMSFRMAASSILQASGDVIVPLRATTVTRIIHIALTPFLMFGWVGFPHYGLAGAALSNLFAQTVGAGINLYALFSGGSRLRLTLRGFELDRHIMWQMVKIGAPATVTGMERAISQLILLRIIAPFGDVALAAYGMTRRLEMFANFGGMGVGNAAGIMVGQNLGAQQPERARRAIAWGIAFATLLKSIIAIPLVIFPVFVVGVFTREPEVVGLTAVWLQILALGAVFMGAGMIFQQAFNVAGDTVTVMIVTFVSLIVVELPLAWLLCYTWGMGPLGIAWAQVIGFTARLVLFLPVYFRGSWLKREVI